MGPMTLERTTSHIKSFIVEHWSNQKLIDVLAFCEAGRMLSGRACCCLLGVTLADRLHDVSCEEQLSSTIHYELALRLNGAYDAETAYMSFAFGGGSYGGLTSQATRDFRLAAIIREVMAERGLAVSEQGELACVGA